MSTEQRITVTLDNGHQEAIIEHTVGAAKQHVEKIIAYGLTVQYDDGFQVYPPGRIKEIFVQTATGAGEGLIQFRTRNVA